MTVMQLGNHSSAAGAIDRLFRWFLCLCRLKAAPPPEEDKTGLLVLLLLGPGGVETQFAIGIFGRHPWR